MPNSLLTVAFYNATTSQTACVYFWEWFQAGFTVQNNKRKCKDVVYFQFFKVHTFHISFIHVICPPNMALNLDLFKMYLVN